MAGFLSSAHTDVGPRRRLNEDAFLQRPDIGLWAVADGMGGHQAGDVASRCVVGHLEAAGEADGPRELMANIEAALGRANAELRAKAEALGGDAVVASTVVGLVLAGARFACFWAGDSRLYMIRGRRALQLTRDDSHVQQLVEAAGLPEAEARRHPLAHVVTRAVGAEDAFDLHVHHGLCLPDDRFVLCSDGFSNSVDMEETVTILGREPTGSAAAALVEAALERGARDNVTVVVVSLEAAGAAGDAETTLPAGRR